MAVLFGRLGNGLLAGHGLPHPGPQNSLPVFGSRVWLYVPWRAVGLGWVPHALHLAHPSSRARGRGVVAGGESCLSVRMVLVTGVTDYVELTLGEVHNVRAGLAAAHAMTSDV
jgi:hypothetical protein